MLPDHFNLITVIGIHAMFILMNYDHPKPQTVWYADTEG